jgi:hypothetical protein
MRKFFIIILFVLVSIASKAQYASRPAFIERSDKYNFLYATIEDELHQIELRLDNSIVPFNKLLRLYEKGTEKHFADSLETNYNGKYKDLINQMNCVGDYLFTGGTSPAKAGFGAFFIQDGRLYMLSYTPMEYTIDVSKMTTSERFASTIYRVTNRNMYLYCRDSVDSNGTPAWRIASNLIQTDYDRGNDYKVTFFTEHHDFSFTKNQIMIVENATSSYVEDISGNYTVVDRFYRVMALVPNGSGKYLVKTCDVRSGEPKRGERISDYQYMLYFEAYDTKSASKKTEAMQSTSTGKYSKVMLTFSDNSVDFKEIK